MKRGWKSLATFLVFSMMPVCSVFAAQNVDPAKGLILENAHVRFVFEPLNMGLSAMVDRKSGHDHIRPVAGKHLLWEVAFGVGRQIYTITNNYRPCGRAGIEASAGGGQRAVLEWSGMRWWQEDEVVSVRVIVDLPADSGVAEWRISVNNQSDYWGLWAVLFPIVNGFPAAGEYDIARPVFASGGRLLKNHAESIWGRYPGAVWPMQFMSLNAGTNAVYFGTEDPHARAKDFMVEPIAGLNRERYPVVFEGRRHRRYLPEPGERIYVRHFPDDMGVAGSDYPDYYPVIFGVYQGGWVEAALRYRPWALRQKWARRGPICQRADIPDMLKNVGIWIREDWEWQGAQGTPEEMNRPLIDAAERLDVPIGLQWYRWHHMPFDQEYPHFLPARAGFKERVRHLVEAGFIVMPYINGSSADMNIPDWDDFAPHAVRDEAGGIRHHFYSDRAGRLLSMCMHQEFWRSRIAGLVDDLMTIYGVNGVYVDQVSGLYHELCFDRNHGHPLGGGSYWADGCRMLLEKTREAARKDGRRCVITSEGTSEIFFDLLDANLTWAQPSDREIPLMPMVYSGYTLFFGSPCDYSKSDNYFRYAQGQALIDGRQNGWMDLGLFRPEYEKKQDYLRECGRTRLAAAKFLTYGRLLKPLAPTHSVPEFAEPGFGWGMYEKQRTAKVACAEARLWQSQDGNLAVILANYVEEPVEFSYSLALSDYGLKAERYQLWDIRFQGETLLGSTGDALKRVEKLSPAGIKIVEIRPVF